MKLVAQCAELRALLLDAIAQTARGTMSPETASHIAELATQANNASAVEVRATYALPLSGERAALQTPALASPASYTNGPSHGRA